MFADVEKCSYGILYIEMYLYAVREAAMSLNMFDWLLRCLVRKTVLCTIAELNLSKASNGHLNYCGIHRLVFSA